VAGVQIFRFGNVAGVQIFRFGNVAGVQIFSFGNVAGVQIFRFGNVAVVDPPSSNMSKSEDLDSSTVLVPKIPDYTCKFVLQYLDIDGDYRC